MDIVMSIAGQIVENLVTPIGRQFGYLCYYHGNIIELREQLDRLGDAKQRVEHSVEAATNNGEEVEEDVKKWLKVVETKMIEAREFLEEAKQANTSCSNWTCPDMKSRHQLSRRAKKMVPIVLKIQEEGKFDKVSYPIAPRLGIQYTKDYVDFESRGLISREVIQALMDDHIKRVGIYGMAGVGKTMMVKEIARQVMEDKLFDKVVMITVSHTPDFKMIQTEIAEFLGLKLHENSLARRADRLRERLHNEKSVLLIFDDIWERLELEYLGISFEDDKKLQKMLMTSRDHDLLCNVMNCQKSFLVNDLTHIEGKSLFIKIVGDLAETPAFQQATHEVIEECAGLPIAITTIANALKNKALPFWKNAVKQLQMSCPVNIRGMQKNVYSSIKLSIDLLESEEAKSLFQVCALLGKQILINEDFLWQCSVGLGIFPDVYTLEEVRNRVHSLVDILSSSCLLHCDEGGRIVLHDIIRDVGIYTANTERIFLTVQNSSDWNKYSNMRILDRLVGVVLPYTQLSGLPKLECPNLEFVILTPRYGENEVLDVQFPNSFFEGVKELHVLYLPHFCLPQLPSSFLLLCKLRMLYLVDCDLEEINLIGELKNLKALSLTMSTIKELPENFGQLTQLQLLDLSYCSNLEVIPPHVLSNLESLEELNMIQSFDKWDEVPSTGRSNASLLELDRLYHLTTLYITISKNVKNLPTLCFEKLVRYDISINSYYRMWMAELKYSEYETLLSGFEDEFKIFRTTQKKLKFSRDNSSQLNDGIRVLLKSCECLELKNKEVNKNLLDEVDCEGFPQLKYLSVGATEMQYFTNGMANSCVSFPALVFLELSNIINLKQICHHQLVMGSFRNLTMLEVVNCRQLRYIFPVSVVKCFSQLQKLSIKECCVIRAIIAVEIDEKTEIKEDITTDIMRFPQLKDLKLNQLPELIGFYSDVDSHILFNKKVTFPKLKRMEIFSTILKMIWDSQIISDSVFELERITVRECHNFKIIFPHEMLKRLQSLEDFRIIDCNSVEEIFEIRGVNNNETSDMLAPQLKVLKLHSLPNLKHVWSLNPQATFGFQNLHELRVGKCGNLNCLFPASVAKGLVQLTKLKITKCVMEEIVAVEEVTETTKFVFPLLTSLVLKSMPNLKCFYRGNYMLECPSLKNLEISGCMKVMFLIEKDTFPNLENLILDESHAMHQTIFQFSAEFFCKLRVLKLFNFKNSTTLCPLLNIHELYDLEELWVDNLLLEDLCSYGLADKEGEHAKMLTRMRVLSLSNLPMLMHLWKENTLFQNVQTLQIFGCGRLKNFAPYIKSFQTLTNLEVSQCNGLTCLLTSQVAKDLVQLKKIVITECKEMAEIVTNEGGGEAGVEIAFKKLRCLILCHLPNLSSFHLGYCTINFPSLTEVAVYGCPKLKIFSKGVVSTPALKKILLSEKGEVEKSHFRYEYQLCDLCHGRYLFPLNRDLNTTIKGFWEESYKTCIGLLFTEKGENSGCSQAE